MNYRDLITVESSTQGAIKLTALVKDPNDRYMDFPFYQTWQYFYYTLDEAVEMYIDTTLNQLNYVFVEDCEDL